MKTKLRVLIVEDSEDDAALVVRELRRGGYAPTFERVESGDTMRTTLASQSWDAVISDYNMPGFNAPHALEILQESGRDIPFIIVSGVVGEDAAVSALRAGAQDYVMKDNLARLVPAMERELREASLRRERNRLEEQLMQAQKMETVGRLTGGVAHDFNNLLTAIMGHSQLGLRVLEPGHSARREFEAIQKASRRAAGLSQQLLTFSPLEAAESQVVDLSALIADMVKMLRRLIGEDIELITSLPPDAGQIRAVPGRMEQVLVNLVSNARDAMSHRGKLMIETSAVTMDEARHEVPPGEYVILAVSDDGMGMTDEVMAHIYEPFFTTKEAGKGTGLGLSTCHSIVTQSGGHILVHSKPREGTTFKIYLPRVQAAATDVLSEEPSDLADADRGYETILVAEDEETVRDIIARALSGMGYKVICAANGVEALKMVQELRGDRIDLLFTDVVMPFMTGTELADRIKDAHPETKVLYTSGYTDGSTIDRIMSNPSAQVMHKPFTAATLMTRVREVLDAR